MCRPWASSQALFKGFWQHPNMSGIQAWALAPPNITPILLDASRPLRGVWSLSCAQGVHRARAECAMSCLKLAQGARAKQAMGAHDTHDGHPHYASICAALPCLADTRTRRTPVAGYATTWACASAHARWGAHIAYGHQALVVSALRHGSCLATLAAMLGTLALACSMLKGVVALLPRPILSLATRVLGVIGVICWAIF